MYTIHFDKRRLIVCPNMDEIGFNPHSIIYNSGSNCEAGDISHSLDGSNNITLLKLIVNH